jgi:glycosyltransferase involved in cell wall biosynthesis
MSLKVLSIAYPLSPVSEDTVGGAEQILCTLDKMLVTRNHVSLMVACTGSRISGTLFPIPRVTGVITPIKYDEIRGMLQNSVQEALNTYHPDIIHMHGVDFYRYFPDTNLPVLVTLHLPFEFYPAQVLEYKRANLFFNFVSYSQMGLYPNSLNNLGVIENGITVERFEPVMQKKDFVLTLGRICPEKGYHLAIDAAKLAKKRIILAGEVAGFEAHRNYFEKEIAPRIDGDQSIFLGAVGFEQKKKLLRTASCLLIPSLVPETSSLVAMEALASGTPVVAFKNGALTEIIHEGLTGFLVADSHEMALAIESIENINPFDCRQAAEMRFRADQMMEKYLSSYFQILRGRSRMGKDIHGISTWSN